MLLKTNKGSYVMRSIVNYRVWERCAVVCGTSVVIVLDRFETGTM
jgi:hypothetical protein